MGNRKLAKLIRSTGSHAPGRKPAKHSIKADGGSPAPKKQRKASEPSRLPQQAQMSQGNILTENHDAEMGLEESLGGAGDAYKALVGMLSAGRGHVSEALRRRRKEAEGQESGSESQESGDGNESGGESESDSEQQAPGTKLARSRQDQAAAAASKTLLRTRWRDSKKAAAEIHEEEQRNGEGQDSGSDDSVGADSATQQEVSLHHRSYCAHAHAVCEVAAAYDQDQAHIEEGEAQTCTAQHSRSTGSDTGGSLLAVIPHTSHPVAEPICSFAQSFCWHTGTAL